MYQQQLTQEAGQRQHAVHGSRDPRTPGDHHQARPPPLRQHGPKVQ